MQGHRLCGSRYFSGGKRPLTSLREVEFLNKFHSRMAIAHNTVNSLAVSFQGHHFFHGDEYKGKLRNNIKHGKGTYKWKTSGAIFDGDWRDGQRNGYGTFSIPAPGGGYQKQYSGGWKNDKRHGYGTHFYSEDEYYEGEWYADKRSGWGRMYYTDGNIYEGEWYDDQRNGQGMLRLANENRYEGSWKDDQKNGSGKFYYLDKGQLYEGVWHDDVPKSGEMMDFDRDQAPDATQYPIPAIELADPSTVLADAQEPYLLDQD